MSIAQRHAFHARIGAAREAGTAAAHQLQAGRQLGLGNPVAALAQRLLDQPGLLEEVLTAARIALTL